MKNKVVLVIMDGVGLTNDNYGNAFKNAITPNLDYLMKNYPMTKLKAHGLAVGLPSDNDMGNSEVGHNALGCGQIYSQGAKLVNEAIENRSIFSGTTWKELIKNCNNTTLHFIGLLSDGNVHSNINHLLVMLNEAAKEGVKRVRIHILLDGRDVEETSALKYVTQLEERLKYINNHNLDYRIASGGGRMKITMDRYESNWAMVELGWKTQVLGEGRFFPDATTAIKTIRKETGEIDQDLDPFVISDSRGAIGKIKNGDSVIFFNFRGDRALELCRAFEDQDFNKFPIKNKPDVYFAGLLQYDADLQIPKKFLTSPPKITNTLTETLIKNNINEYAISETQKFGHVTYFWNGNRTEKFSTELETWEEVASDIISFDKKPEMKATEITDKLIEAIKTDKYDFLRCNYPNGDMVGHTGNYDATIKAMEAVDNNIGRLMKVALEKKYIMLVIADHGNCEEMYQKPKEQYPNKNAKTSHTLNPVPFIMFGNNVDNYEIKLGEFGLANVASTICVLLDVKPNNKFLSSIIIKKQKV